MTGTTPEPLDRGNAALRGLLSSSGLTYDALARAVTQIARENDDQVVRPNRSAIHRWLGGAVPEAGSRQYISEALSRRLGRTVSVAELGWPTEDSDAQLGLHLAKDPVTSLSDLANSDLRRRTFLTSAAYSVMALAGVMAGDSAAAADSLVRTSRAAAGGRLIGLEADYRARFAAFARRPA